MDSRTFQPKPILAILGVFLVFASILTWQIERVLPVIQDNLIFIQLAIAATVIAVFRSEIGLTTFGVFGPTIIAFAWIEIGPYWGLILVTYLFILAIATREIVDPLNLTTPHRLATVLIVVIFGFLVLDGVSKTQPTLPQFGFSLLFPAILTAWYGDRFVNQLQDVGWLQVLQRLFLTVAVIFLAFVVVTFDPFMHWFAVTPVAWVGLVGANLYLGHADTGRLSEYLRFGALRRSLNPGQDSRLEILTMRIRNRDFINRYNPAHLVARLDKIYQKRLFHGLDIPTPKTYATLTSVAELDEIDDLLAESAEFAIKPASGLGGEGILVVSGAKSEGAFETSKGERTAAQIRAHAKDIIEGRYEFEYATHGQAYIEELVNPSGILQAKSRIGVPDVRVILLRGIPVMAMARLPTEESHGTANIHTGAIAVGLDLETGRATGAFQQTRRRWLDTHPDTGGLLTDISIDDWHLVLELASRAAIATHLGYAGVDIVFDRDAGPIVLEVNRRPGLGIQNANMAGLLGRLRYAEQFMDDLSLKPATERVRMGQQFASDNWGGDSR